jgi:hypothetical protein
VGVVLDWFDSHLLNRSHVMKEAETEQLGTEELNELLESDRELSDDELEEAAGGDWGTGTTTTGGGG